jgi:hypothetical protein
MKKIENRNEGSQKGMPKSTELNKHGELKTDYPLSEKDEVKQAETTMRRERRKLL